MGAGKAAVDSEARGVRSCPSHVESRPTFFLGRRHRGMFTPGKCRTPKPHTGLTQDVGEGRAAAAAAASCGEHEQRGEESWGLSLLWGVLLEVMSLLGTE